MTHTLSQAAAAGEFGAMPEGKFATFLNRWRERRQAEAMLRLDDRMLEDIGLTRGDIEHALGTGAINVATTLEGLRNERMRTTTRGMLGGRAGRPW